MRSLDGQERVRPSPPNRMVRGVRRHPTLQNERHMKSKARHSNARGTMLLELLTAGSDVQSTPLVMHKDSVDHISTTSSRSASDPIPRVGAPTAGGLLVDLVANHKNATAPESKIPPEFHMYDEDPVVSSSLVNPQSAESRYDPKGKTWTARRFPSLHPTARSEVVLTAGAVDAMLARLGKRQRTTPEGRAVESLQELLDETRVWDMAITEVVRQTFVGCSQRGVLLDRAHKGLMEIVQALAAKVEDLEGAALGAQRSCPKCDQNEHNCKMLKQFIANQYNASPRAPSDADPQNRQVAQPKPEGDEASGAAPVGHAPKPPPPLSSGRHVSFRSKPKAVAGGVHSTDEQSDAGSASQNPALEAEAAVPPVGVPSGDGGNAAFVTQGAAAMDAEEPEGGHSAAPGQPSTAAGAWKALSRLVVTNGSPVRNRDDSIEHHVPIADLLKTTLESKMASEEMSVPLDDDETEEDPDDVEVPPEDEMARRGSGTQAVSWRRRSSATERMRRRSSSLSPLDVSAGRRASGVEETPRGPGHASKPSVDKDSLEVPEEVYEELGTPEAEDPVEAPGAVPRKHNSSSGAAMFRWQRLVPVMNMMKQHPGEGAEDGDQLPNAQSSTLSQGETSGSALSSRTQSLMHEYGLPHRSSFRPSLPLDGAWRQSFRRESPTKECPGAGFEAESDGSSDSSDGERDL